MTIMNHGTDRVNPAPCPCESCREDADARDLAAQLGMAPADGPDDDLDLAAEHADRIDAHAAAAEAIRWGLWNPIFKRPTDDDEPGQLARDWEPPSGEDAAWWAAETAEGGCGIDELSPEEEWIEAFGEPSFERACRFHAEMMEEEAQEAEYHRLLSVLGGFSADF